MKNAVFWFISIMINYNKNLKKKKKLINNKILASGNDEERGSLG